MLFGTSEDDRGYRGATVTIGGTPYQAVGYPQISRHLDNLRSSCRVTLDQEPPTFEVGQAVPAWIDMAFEGKGTVRVFTGYLGPVSVPFGARTITLVDNLFKLKNSPEQGCDTTEAIYFDDLAPDTAMVKVLMSAGIAEADIDTPSLTTALEAISPTSSVDDLTLRVCPLMAHCMEVNQKLEDLYRDLCTFLCIVGYCDSDGKIRFVPKDTRPVENPPLSFDNEGGYPILDGERERSGFEDVVRVCTCKLASITVDGVEGADYTSKWVATAVENGVPYDVSLSAPLVQTDPMADRLTEYYGELGCRQEQRFTVETARDPHLKPGMHALFRYNTPDHDPILPTLTPGYLVGVEDSDTRARLTVSTGPSEERGYQQGCPPVAIFTFQVIAETVLIGDVPQTIYDVALDGSGSYDPDGELVSFEWTVTGTTPRLAPANTAQSLTVLDAVEDVSIILTVTDNNDPANTATLTQSLEAPGVVVQYRRLQAIKDGQWGVLPKDTWFWWPPPGTTATAVARYNEKGDLWCGCANGALYKRSQDDFSQSPELVTTLDSAITDIYVGEPFANEAAINSIIAAHGTKATWTHDQFTTAQSYDFSAAIQGVVVDAYTVEHLTVLVGNQVKESWDDGATWTDLLVGAEGSQAEDIGVAPWDTGVIFSSATGADAVVFLSGATWSGVTLDGEPQTITPGVTEETFRVATSTSQLYRFTRQPDGSYLVESIGQVDATSGNTRRWVRDGAFNVVYGADATQLFKQLADEPAQIYPLVMGNAVRVGYAGLGGPQQQVYDWQDATLMWHTHPDLRQMTLNGDQVTGWISTGTEDYALVGHPSGSEPVFNGSYVQGAVNKKMTCVLPLHREGRFRALYVVTEIRGDASRYVLVRDSGHGGAHTGWYKPCIMVLSGERVGLNLRGGVTHGSNQGPYVISCPFNTKVLIGMRQDEDGKTYVTLNGNPMGSWTPEGDPGHSATFCGLGSIVAQYSSSSRTYAIIGYLDSDLPLLTTEQEQMIINNLTELYGTFGV